MATASGGPSEALGLGLGHGGAVVCSDRVHGGCLHQNLEERTQELEASKIVLSRNRSDVNQYQLI